MPRRPRLTLLPVVAVTAAAAGAALLGLSGCGTASQPQPASASASLSSSHRAAGAAAVPAPPAAHPQAIEPVAGAVPAASTATGDRSSASAGVTSPGGAATAQPVSDATIRRELAASGLSAGTTQGELTPNGLAIAPIAAPNAVQTVIDAGNQIAHLPYIWGGGHGTYEDTGYDCSGSLSFVLGAAGLLSTTMTSGELMNWGAPGPGRWITVFAAPGHTFMYVGGLRFDTVALAETGSRWSNRSAGERGGFVARHPPGL